jgi:hypothetical protein
MGAFGVSLQLIQTLLGKHGGGHVANYLMGLGTAVRAGQDRQKTAARLLELPDSIQNCGILLSTMTDRILLVPLDDRPVTGRLPQCIGAVAGATVELPPTAWIGNLIRRADGASLMAWLQAAAPSTAAMVLALDTLAYGGLVGSRQSRDPAAEITERLLPLWQLRDQHPDLQLAGFITIPRLSATAAPEEEAPYWPQYGVAIAAYSRAFHLAEVEPTAANEQALDTARAAVPAEVLADYLGARERNQAINRMLVEWTAAGVFDLLYVTVDDSAEWGLNVLERDDLTRLVAARGLEDRILVYPGADEVACSLLARLLLRRSDVTPTFFPVYSEDGGEDAVTMYEGLPLRETLALHLRAAGIGRAASPESADCQLFLHSPERVGGDFWLGIDLPEDTGAFPEWFVAAIATALQMGSPVAVADVAWANAAHPAFVQRLVETAPVRNLMAFAGWNTAGNTLGTVLAHAAMRHLALERGGGLQAQELAHQRLLFERFAEDWLYMGVERPAVVRRHEAINLNEVGRAVGLRAESTYLRYWKGGVVMRVSPDQMPEYWRLGEYRRIEPGFPWSRLFDIDFRADFDLEVIP